MSVEVNKTDAAQRQSLASHGSVDHDQSFVMILYDRHGHRSTDCHKTQPRLRMRASDVLVGGAG